MWMVLTFEVAALYLSRDQWYPRYIGKCVSSMFYLDEEAKRKIRLPGRKVRTTLQSMARNFTKLQLFLVDMQIHQHDFRFREQRAKQNRSITFKRRQLQKHSLELWYLAAVQVADMKRKPRVEYQKVTSIPLRTSFQKYHIKSRQYVVVSASVGK